MKAINFDWDSPDPRISFRDSKVLAFDGSIGYGIGGGRVELEVGYEKFKTKGVKRGEGEEEGIYLLAKDLAYNVALDQTTKLSEGIQQLQRKELHEVSKAINILDSTMKTDQGICKDKAYNHHSAAREGDELANMCGVKHSTNNASNATDVGLSLLWKESTNTNGSSGSVGGNYVKKEADGTVGPKTSAKISKDVSTLTREQKGVVSSAFAKAHEGAEIPT